MLDLGPASCPRVLELSMRPIIRRYGGADASFVGELLESLLAAHVPSEPGDTGSAHFFRLRAANAQAMKGALSNVGFVQLAATAGAVDIIASAIVLRWTGELPDRVFNDASYYEAGRHTVEELLAAFPTHVACLDRRITLLSNWFTEKVGPLLARFPAGQSESRSESDDDGSL